MIIAMSGHYDPSLTSLLSKSHTIFDITNTHRFEKANAAEMIITRGSLTINESVISQFPSLRKIIKAGSGVDTIDLSAAQKAGINVVATGGGNESVAEIALTLLLSCLKRIPIMNECVKKMDWSSKARFIPHDLSSRKIGIVGFGKTGQSFAIILRALNTPVFAWDHSIYKDTYKQKILKTHNIDSCKNLSDLIKSVDVISLHLPLNEKTRSLISKNEFSEFKKGTILINTSRAVIVEKQSLIDALNDGTLDSAGLDVHYNEGDNENADSIFYYDKVVLTPHIGSQSHQAQKRIANLIMEEVAKTKI